MVQHHLLSLWGMIQHHPPPLPCGERANFCRAEMLGVGLVCTPRDPGVVSGLSPHRELPPPQAPVLFLLLPQPAWEPWESQGAPIYPISFWFCCCCFGHALCRWTFPSQRSKLSHTCDDARSLTVGPPGNSSYISSAWGSCPVPRAGPREVQMWSPLLGVPGHLGPSSHLPWILL